MHEPSVCERQLCEKYQANGKRYPGRLRICKRHMIRSIGMVCAHTMPIDRIICAMADAKSVWSWRKIVESSAEFLYR